MKKVTNIKRGGNKEGWIQRGSTSLSAFVKKSGGDDQSNWIETDAGSTEKNNAIYLGGS